MASSVKQYLHCIFKSVTTANSSIVIHFQITLPSLCLSHLTLCSILTYPLPPVLQHDKNLLLLSYCIACIVLSAHVTNRLHKKPVNLQSIYAKVYLLLSLSGVNTV